MTNILEGSAPHLQAEGKLKGIKYFGMDLLPDKNTMCNFRCVDCCAERKLACGIKRLSVSEINLLLDEAKDLGAETLVIMGVKEPTIVRRFKGTVKSAHKRCLRPYAFTNGFRGLGENETIPFLYEHGASLVLQVKSLREDVFEAHSRVSGSYREVMNNIRRVREVFSDKFGRIGRFGLRRVAINMVVDDTNKGELLRMLDFCGDHFIPVFNTEMKIGAARDNKDVKVTPEIIQAIREAAPDMMPLGTTYVPSEGLRCVYMKNTVNVLESKVILCPYAFESAKKLGDVRCGGLKPYKDKANSVLDGFFGKEHPAYHACYGDPSNSRCILRHERYEQLIQSLGPEK